MTYSITNEEIVASFPDPREREKIFSHEWYESDNICTYTYPWIVFGCRKCSAQIEKKISGSTVFHPETGDGIVISCEDMVIRDIIK